MDTHRSIRVTVVPRRIKKRRKAVASRTHRQVMSILSIAPGDMNNLKTDVPTQSSTDIVPWAVSTDSSPLSSTVRSSQSIARGKPQSSAMELGHIDRLKRNNTR